MEPVIDPWIIYWVSVLNNIGSTLSLIVCMSVVSSVIIGVVHLVDLSDNYSDDLGFPNWFKYFKLSIAVACISSLICVFIPDKQTMLTMMVASYITPDNLNVTTDYIVELVQRITEAVKEVK
jgi:hypothetical protein